MSYTKRQIITQAFEEISLAAYDFDLSPEQMQSALKRLDSMMATWNAKGIQINYPLPDSPSGGDLDDDAGIPDSANEAVVLNLAIRLAPARGKTVPMETKAAAKSALDALMLIAAAPREMKLSNQLPLGAGNKRTVGEDPFINQPQTGPLIAPTEEVSFNGN